MNKPDVTCYVYESGSHNRIHEYSFSYVFLLLGETPFAARKDRRLLEVGCGNGIVASAIRSRGWAVMGIDPSEQGIIYAREVYPKIDLS
ncbi:MAG: methyltransferase domain-containing protein [Pseudomonadales bacterium]|nr:methyltransferase domain-containing protein [Pseudomonadales bacterium]MCP5188070.1 methyltransferase domain-containing protein [Pseudomonadales bacterium]